MSDESVHRTHCCVDHGCKYMGDGSDCPVCSGVIVQDYPCEVCAIIKNRQDRIERSIREFLFEDERISLFMDPEDKDYIAKMLASKLMESKLAL